MGQRSGHRPPVRHPHRFLHRPRSRGGGWEGKEEVPIALVHVGLFLGFDRFTRKAWSVLPCQVLPRQRRRMRTCWMRNHLLVDWWRRDRIRISTPWLSQSHFALLTYNGRGIDFKTVTRTWPLQAVRPCPGGHSQPPAARGKGQAWHLSELPQLLRPLPPGQTWELPEAQSLPPPPAGEKKRGGLRDPAGGWRLHGSLSSGPRKPPRACTCVCACLRDCVWCTPVGKRARL